ncbi:MAG: hypothetical protein ACETVR_02230 [Candidatus Bathyarchaeia archaeon]
MKRLSVAVMEATGTVGQRFCSMLRDHPWFEVSTLTGKSSAGKPLVARGWIGGG